MSPEPERPPSPERSLRRTKVLEWASSSGSCSSAPLGTSSSILRPADPLRASGKRGKEAEGSGSAVRRQTPLAMGGAGGVGEKKRASKPAGRRRLPAGQLPPFLSPHWDPGGAGWVLLVTLQSFLFFPRSRTSREGESEEKVRWSGCPRLAKQPETDGLYQLQHQKVLALGLGGRGGREGGREALPFSSPTGFRGSVAAWLQPHSPRPVRVWGEEAEKMRFSAAPPGVGLLPAKGITGGGVG